jgi:hypothetical protein
MSYESVIRSLWRGRCDVYVYENVTDSITGRDRQVMGTVYENVQCRLSYQSSPQTGRAGGAPTAEQSIKVFIGREVDVPAGAYFAITQNGVTAYFHHSGLAKTYSHHQEIELERTNKWA